MVTNYGEGVGYKTGGGQGQVRFCPFEKGAGGGKRSSHAEGGQNKFWGSFSTGAKLKGGGGGFQRVSTL